MPPLSLPPAGRLALLVFTSGAFTHGAMLALWLREVGRGSTTTTPDRSRRGEAELVGGALLAIGFATPKDVKTQCRSRRQRTHSWRS